MFGDTQERVRSPGFVGIGRVALAAVYPLQGVEGSVDCPVSTHTPMQKTKKSIAKRFKLSGSGKLVRRSPGMRHLMRKKSVKQKRRNGRDKLVAPGRAANLVKALPHGLS